MFRGHTNATELFIVSLKWNCYWVLVFRLMVGFAFLVSEYFLFCFWLNLVETRDREMEGSWKSCMRSKSVAERDVGEDAGGGAISPKSMRQWSLVLRTWGMGHGGRGREITVKRQRL